MNRKYVKDQIYRAKRIGQQKQREQQSHCREIIQKGTCNPLCTVFLKGKFDCRIYVDYLPC